MLGHVFLGGGKKQSVLHLINFFFFNNINTAGKYLNPITFLESKHE